MTNERIKELWELAGGDAVMIPKAFREALSALIEERAKRRKAETGHYGIQELTHRCGLCQMPDTDWLAAEYEALGIKP